VKGEWSDSIDSLITGVDPSFPSCTWERACLRSCASRNSPRSRNRRCPGQCNCQDSCIPEYNPPWRGCTTERGNERRCTEAPLHRRHGRRPKERRFKTADTTKRAISNRPSLYSKDDGPETQGAPVSKPPKLGRLAVWKAPFLGRQEATIVDPRSGGLKPPTLQSGRFQIAPPCIPRTTVQRPKRRFPNRRN
jgi:hypothetical protein